MFLIRLVSNQFSTATATGQLYETRKLCSYQIPRSFCHIWFLFKRCFVNGVLREPKWYVVSVARNDTDSLTIVRRLIIRITLHVVVAFILSFLYDSSIGRDSSCLDVSEAEQPCMVMTENGDEKGIDELITRCLVDSARRSRF